MVDKYMPGRNLENFDRTSRPAGNGPDRPPVITQQVTVYYGDRHSRDVMQFDKTTPLTPQRVVPNGGGRPIGGGTSPEALRRAAKKAQRRG